MVKSSVAKVLHALNPRQSISNSLTGACPEVRHDQEWLAQHTQSHGKNILHSIAMSGRAILEIASDQAKPVDTRKYIITMVHGHHCQY
jgi:hypothetical protein